VGFVADLLGFGNAAGPHFDFDYSTATSAGITNLTQAQLASTSGVASIITAHPDGRSVVLRSDVDVDPIAANGYPRSEWREKGTNGTTDRAFTDTTGDHAVEILLLPMHLPPVKPAFVLLQEHDSAQDLLEIVVQNRSDYATSGKLEVALKVAVGGSSSSSGLPRFIADFGTPAELATNPKWLQAKLRTGAINAGAAGWSATVNGVTINSWDAGIPTRDAAVGATAYYKTGMYLQTKWTGSGTGGLETDRNEYGEAAWRFIRVTHNGESAPFIPTIGSRVADAISNVRWGAKVEGVNTGATTPAPLSITLTPALPASLVDGDMIYVIARSRRTLGSSIVSSPAIESVSPSWSRLNTSSGTEFVSTKGDVPGDLTSHSQRMRIWCRAWFSGMTAPVLTYGPTGTDTDIMSAQCFAIFGGKLGLAAEVVDQIPANFNFGATSTTVLGPTAALPANAEAGALALALLANEFNVTSGAATTVSGDGLTWAEGGEGIGTTVSFQAWANDWAIVPATAGQAITAKQAANSAHTTGKSASALLTLRRAQKRRQGNRPASVS